MQLLRRYALTNRLTLATRTLTLGDRDVAWINATWDQLRALPFASVPLAEIRRPELIDTIEDLTREEQDELAEDLAARAQAAGA